MRSTTALIILAILLSLILGILIGMIIRTTAAPIPATVLRPDTREKVPVVTIDGVEDGHVIGTARGGVRVFLGERMIVPGASGSFRVPAGDFLKNVTTVHVPAGMHFVASKRGKKYYPVVSASAMRLAPENRVYFADHASAERAGFSPGE